MPPDHSIPLVIKILLTAFVVVLVPIYRSSYGLPNFLYFCDVALFLTCLGVWLESPLLLSMQAVAIILPQCLWLIDFFSEFLLHHRLTGMTAYMFNPATSLFTRLLSLFHGWLPLLLLYLVHRTGYDRRAFVAQAMLGWLLLLICYFLLAGNININYVRGIGHTPQTWMRPILWLGVMMVIMPVVLYWPAHLILSRLIPAAGVAAQ